MFSLFFLPSTQQTGRFGRVGQIVLWLAILAALIWFGSTATKLAQLNIMATVFLYIVLTQAWNILGGYGGYLNFGTVTFFGAGAYTSAVIFHYFGISPFISAPLAGCVAALLGILIGIPTLRLRGAYFAVVTMIITFAMQILALDLPFTQGALGIYLMPPKMTPLALERMFYFLLLSFAVVVTVLVYVVEHSNFGWALIAIREDEDAAEIVGVRTNRIKLVANAIGTFIMGTAGSIYAQRILYLEPTGTFSFDISLNVVLMAVIGGAGTWQGPLIGAPLVLLVADALRVTFTSEVNRVIFSLVVICVALFVPGGLMSLVSRLSGARKKPDSQKPDAPG